MGHHLWVPGPWTNIHEEKTWIKQEMEKKSVVRSVEQALDDVPAPLVDEVGADACKGSQTAEHNGTRAVPRRKDNAMCIT